MAHSMTKRCSSLRKSIMLLAAVALLQLPNPGAHAAPSTEAVPQTFRVENGQFLLDGKPFQIISGEIHYARVPRAYWRTRLRMAKAMGLNTVTTYVFWNEHEPQPGLYDFSGPHDVAEFIREAQEAGLYVILRPGPYSCAEWEWGGYPAWLLKQHDIVVRSNDPRFMTPARRWIMRLGKELAPLQVGNGGPILAVQVENEYGSFGKDHSYMEQVHQALIDAGFNKALLYTDDGPEELADGSLPGLPAVINFGPGRAKDGFALLRRFRPEGPFMAGEYWGGWFDHWGEKHHTTNAPMQGEELDWILRQGYSVSLYMFHGGTSFGWMNGANSDGRNYQPDVTSYDYDAPLDESGHPTQKFFLFRQVITKVTGVTPPPAPAVDPTIAVPAFRLDDSRSLWESLPQPVKSEHLLTMEDLNQAYGYILYRTVIPGPAHGTLVLDQLHDYAEVYANGALIGTLDRRLARDRLDVDLKESNTRLDILVENSGRINFTAVMRGERKGITRQVTLNGKALTNWKIYSLPMEELQASSFTSEACVGPCFYRGSFALDEIGDTFLYTGNFTKGFVWVNGHPLGRIWNIGPQKTLYLPGAWLNRGRNQVIVLDLQGTAGKTLEGRTIPDLDN